MTISQIYSFLSDKRVPPKLLWTVLNQAKHSSSEKEKVNNVFISWTVDVENIVSNDPELLNNQVDSLTHFFKQNKITGTFFVQGEIVTEISNSLRNAVKSGIEVGLHGYTHDNWGSVKWFLNDKILTRVEKEKFLNQALSDFKTAKLDRPVSFRAPNLSISSETLNLLYEKGFILDSSYGSYLGHGSTNSSAKNGQIAEIPVSSPGSSIISWKGLLPYLSFQMLTVENIIKWTDSEAQNYITEVMAQQAEINLPAHFVILSHNWEFSKNSKFAYGSTENFKKILKFLDLIKLHSNDVCFETMANLAAKLWKK